MRSPLSFIAGMRLAAAADRHLHAARRTLSAPLVACFLMLSPAASMAADIHELHGKASWYGIAAQGKRTASGEAFDRRALTAAHRTLPFGTVVRIFNLKNQRQTLVRINDRGPYAKNRIVDISRRAAEYLRITRSGLARVAIEVVSNTRGEALNRENGFYVHMADEKTPGKANALAFQIGQRVNQPARTLFSLQGPHPGYAVCLGPYATFGQAERVFAALEKDGADGAKAVSYGIIEASRKGGDIPRHVPPYVWPKNVHPKKKHIHGLKLFS
jgi:rare lipoprotein A